MKTMIFAAGLGTRLKPITDTLPKALVPVKGKPLLYHVCRKLSMAGLDDFVVNVYHFADKIIGYLSTDPVPGAGFAVSDERPELLETGGGIKHAKELLLDGAESEEPFLVHNVDIISNLDVKWFLSQWRSDALAVLLVSERVTRRYLLFDDDMRLVGWTNIATGEVRSPYSDLDPSKCRRYAFSGIHLISNSVFGVMDSEGMPERFSIMDFYLRIADRYPVYACVQPGLELVDVGKVDTLAALEQGQSQILSQLP